MSNLVILFQACVIVFSTDVKVWTLPGQISKENFQYFPYQHAGTISIVDKGVLKKSHQSYV